MMRCLPISRRWAGCISVCPATICGKGQTGSPLASSAPSTIPWPASNSWHSQCSHYVCQIVVWRTNLEVTPIGARQDVLFPQVADRSEEHTSELQSLMRISYAVFCLKKKNQ